MPPEPARFIRRLQSLASDLLVLGGVVLTGCGVVYFFNGWRAGAWVLLLASAFGTLLVASGMFLRHPATIATMRIATGTFGLSTALLGGLYLTMPMPQLFLILVASFSGCAGSWARLRRLGG